MCVSQHQYFSAVASLFNANRLLIEPPGGWALVDRITNVRSLSLAHQQGELCKLRFVAYL